MSWSFNPFTGNLDLTGSSGAVVFEGEVETFADLPEVVGDPPVGSSYLVRTSTGVWLVNKRQSGIWIRRNNTGVRATDWEYGGDYPVTSVNGQTGNVSLTASSVGAAAATHASTHHTGGTDAIAPNNISAAWALAVSGQFVAGNVLLSEGRNRRITLSAVATANVDLPFNNNVDGDVVTLVGGQTFSGTLTIRRAANMSGGTPVNYDTLATMTASGQSFTFVSDGTAIGWSLRRVDTHTHAAADISDSTATGRSVLTATDAAAARSAISAASTTHANSHSTSGSDPISPSSIGAQSLFTSTSATWTSNGNDQTLTAGRAVVVTANNYFAASVNLTLPTTGNLAGDVFVVKTTVSPSGNIVIRKLQFGSVFETLATITANGQSYRFIAASGTGSDTWQIDPVYTHNHAAADVTSGVFDNARVNFAAPAAIGSTTPAAGTFTDLVATTRLKLPLNAPASPTAGDLYRTANSIRFRNESNVERYLLVNSNNLSELTSAGTARDNLSLGSSSTVTFGGLMNTPVGVNVQNSGSFTTLSASGAVSGTGFSNYLASPPAIGGTAANSGAFTTLSANNGTLTAASAPVLDLSQTWNNAAVAFTGLRFDVTNTASAGGSRLAHFTVGGTGNVLGIYRDVTGSSGFSATRIEVGSGGVTWNIRTRTGGGVGCNFDGAVCVGGSLQFNTAGSTSTNAGDVALNREAADTLALQRTTNPQTFRLYNTFTDASNYERAKIAWSSNVLQIGTEKGGTGSARALQFQTDGTTRFTFSTGGSLFIGDGSAQTNNFFGWSGNGGFRAQQTSTGVITLLNWAETDFNRLQFGGTTSSFPALKRSSTTLQVRLADDSAFAPLISSQVGIGVASPERPLHIQTSDAMGRIDRTGANGPAFLMVRMATLGSVTSSWLFGPATGFASVANDDFSIIDFGTTTSGTGGTQRLTIAKSDGQLTVNGNLNLSTKDIVTDTTTGTKIGTATTQKIGFFNATPVVQQSAIADATDAASTQARLNDLLAAMRSLGLIAT